ncbi:C40 family peptidase [Demequina sp. NBRC 110051]|uniref:C40 family peptidase n=1 Tax=Demequina sp. NBRC 110051 TaxID=1570340 RepID=UPI00190EE7C6|nr:C40 family peptidase [Demequina sp. NBRC 110051]
MRARTRAVAATAGAALVVVPLTGAAAAALVSQDVTAETGTSEIALEADAASADLAAVASEVTAAGDAGFDVETPQIDVSEDPEPIVTPPPAPAQTSTSSNSSSSSSSSSSSTSSSTSTSKARPVAKSSSVKAAISGSAIIAEASKYVGVPYVSGGSSPSGFDCSGFTSYVYGQFGISLPRSSGAYYSVGTRVSNPQPGDIIVSPGHVGIYAGPNLQIDAPRPGKTIQFRPIWQSNPVYVRVS